MNFKCLKEKHQNINVRLVCFENKCPQRLICEFCAIECFNQHKEPHLNFVSLNATSKLLQEFQQIYQSFKTAYNYFKSLQQMFQQYTEYLNDLSIIYDKIIQDYSIIDQGPYNNQQYENIITKIKDFVIPQSQKVELDHYHNKLVYINNLINFSRDQSIPFSITKIITELNKTLYIQSADIKNSNNLSILTVQ
ncbi:hypothetical protein pb186bvf_000593 [Paramecium bursaria]